MGGMKLELKDGTLYELDPTKNYLVAFDKLLVTQADAHDFMEAAKNYDFHNLKFAYMTNGDPSTALIIEEQ
jgi:hypothetical protein